MKRSAFVSNSSSSSFVVIGDEDLDFPKINTHDLVVPFDLGGHYEFDRGGIIAVDVGSRINWAFLIAESWFPDEFLDEDNVYRDPYWNDHDASQYGDLIAMTKDVLQNTLGVSSITVLFRHEEDDDYSRPQNFSDTELTENEKKFFSSIGVYGFIDHGSLLYECSKNIEIFNNELTLMRFLFDTGSRIEITSD
jgi:hypothetical protein